MSIYTFVVVSHQLTDVLSISFEDYEKREKNASANEKTRMQTRTYVKYSVKYIYA